MFFRLPSLSSRCCVFGPLFLEFNQMCFFFSSVLFPSRSLLDLPVELPVEDASCPVPPVHSGFEPHLHFWDVLLTFHLSSQRVLHPVHLFGLLLLFFLPSLLSSRSGPRERVLVSAASCLTKDPSVPPVFPLLPPSPSNTPVVHSLPLLWCIPHRPRQPEESNCQTHLSHRSRSGVCDPGSRTTWR